MSEAPAQPQDTPKPASKGLTLGIIAGALILGGGVGTFVIGPRFAGPAAAAEQAGGEGSEEHADREGNGQAEIFSIENLVVNPAGSQGSRFLMVSIGFEVKDAAAKVSLQNREMQVRDTIVATLQAETLESLTGPGARDRIKVRLADAVADLAGGRPAHVFLPQFVIQ